MDHTQSFSLLLKLCMQGTLLTGQRYWEAVGGTEHVESTDLYGQGRFRTGGVVERLPLDLSSCLLTDHRRAAILSAAQSWIIMSRTRSA